MIPIFPLHHIFDWFFETVNESPEDDDMLYYMHISNPKYKAPTRVAKFLDDVWNVVWHRNFGVYGRFTHDLYWGTRYLLQRIFRADHTPDIELFDMIYPLTKRILPKLKAFRKYQKEHGAGYPTYFCDWDPPKNDAKYGGMGMTKAQYDKAKKEGKFAGGGSKAWLKTIDEMIFGFERILCYDGVKTKEAEAFIKKYHLPNVWAKTAKNRHMSYYYRSKGGNFMSSGAPIRKSEEKKYTFLGKHSHYHNYDAENEIYERAQRGLDLFAKHFLSLWD